jgi:acetoin utilization protein AcuB
MLERHLICLSEARKYMESSHFSAEGLSMIVRDIMVTKMITVEPDDTLSHAANIFRQYQFHHLPVVRRVDKDGAPTSSFSTAHSIMLLEGLITAEDIHLVVALARQSSSSEVLLRPWQERQVTEVMHHASIRVTSTTSVAAAAQLLVERNLNALPIVEYELIKDVNYAVLVGLITRSDLLLALARAMGAYEPGMQLSIPLPLGDLTPLARILLLAEELHVQVRSVLAAPLEAGVPRSATVRLGTINPTPLLVRLREAQIDYTFADPLPGGDIHA